MLGVTAPEKLVRMYIRACWQSLRVTDDMVGDDHRQGRLAFLGREAESVAIKPRFRAHKEHRRCVARSTASTQ
jgi:hypothetical protein